MEVLPEAELVAVTTQLKARLLTRGKTIENMITRMAKSEAGLGRRLNPEVLDTLQRDAEQLKVDNDRDSVIYATLRWVLGLAKEIDPNDLKLDE